MLYHSQPPLSADDRPEDGAGRPSFLSRYLARIGLASRPAPTLEGLALLQAAHPELAAFPIQESRPELDYRYRLVVPKSVAAQAVARMVTAVDYRNVKSTAHANESKVGAAFVQALHQIWSALLAVQVEGRKGKRG